MHRRHLRVSAGIDKAGQNCPALAVDPLRPGAAGARTAESEPSAALRSSPIASVPVIGRNRCRRHRRDRGGRTRHTRWDPSEQGQPHSLAGRAIPVGAVLTLENHASPARLTIGLVEDGKHEATGRAIESAIRNEQAHHAVYRPMGGHTTGRARRKSGSMGLRRLGTGLLGRPPRRLSRFGKPPILPLAEIRPRAHWPVG